MTRLQSQLQRLYLQGSPSQAGEAADAASLTDAQGRVRAMVLELARPAEWAALSTLWQGVQKDLALPAPAIAVNGVDGYQLWFSLQQPLAASGAHAFLQALCARYLPGIAPHRIDLMPALARRTDMVPAQQADVERWSAFVAPDLAPVFAETPWLDIPPSPDGQADLLSRLDSIQPPAFEAALAQLTPPAALASPANQATHDSAPEQAQDLLRTDAYQADPKRFLLDVMNNDAVALSLRIEAAKALLPHQARAD